MRYLENFPIITMKRNVEQGNRGRNQYDKSKQSDKKLNRNVKSINKY